MVMDCDICFQVTVTLASGLSYIYVYIMYMDTSYGNGL